MNTSTIQVLQEQMLPDLGRARLHASSQAQRTVYGAELYLNPYQSNCLSQWLTMRWSLASLRGSNLVLGADAQVLVQLPLPAQAGSPTGADKKAICQAEEQARSFFKAWGEQLQKEMIEYLRAHA
ncbi:MAG TPA: hypothetical protein VFV39_07180 [Limnobacter sp.]|nr:hypothetical protein [Limnobacter sp.]